MFLLIDTNVILDYLLERQPQFDDVESVFLQFRNSDIEGYVAFHSMSIIWYMMRKRPIAERRKSLLKITNLLTVTAASHSEVVNAIKNEDFFQNED